MVSGTAARQGKVSVVMGIAAGQGVWWGSHHGWPRASLAGVAHSRVCFQMQSDSDFRLWTLAQFLTKHWLDCPRAPSVKKRYAKQMGIEPQLVREHGCFDRDPAKGHHLIHTAHVCSPPGCISSPKQVPDG